MSTWKAGDIKPDWGDRPLSAREAAFLNEREAADLDIAAQERARWGGPSPHAGEGQRKLSPEERIEARHLLQQLAEQARTARDAMDPQHGMAAVTVDTWCAQWRQLKNELDDFTHRVIENKSAAGGVPDRNA